MESCSETNNRQTIRFPPIQIRDLSVEFHSETNNRQTIRFSPIQIQDLSAESIRKPTIAKQYDFPYKKSGLACGIPFGNQPYDFPL